MALLRLMGVFGLDTRPFHSAMNTAETRVVRARGKLGSGISTLVGGIGIRSMLTAVQSLGDTADEIREKFDKVGLNISDEDVQRIIAVNKMIENTSLRIKKNMTSVADLLFKVVTWFLDGVELIARVLGAYTVGGRDAAYKEIDKMLEEREEMQRELDKDIDEAMKSTKKEEESRGPVKEDAKILLTGAVRGGGDLAAIGGFSQFDASPNGIQSKQLRELQRITKNTESLKINL